MRDAKSEIKDEILTKMFGLIGPAQRAQLEEAIVVVLNRYDVQRSETSLATTDDTNEHLIEMFTAIKGQRIAPDTLRFYIYTIHKLLDMTHKSITTISPLDVEYFLHAMRKRGNSTTTVNNYLRNISAFYRWFVKQRILTFNPCDQVEQLKTIEKPIEKLSVEEFDRLRSACNTLRERCLIELLRCTALRSEEIPILTIQDIDWSTGELIAYIPKQRKYRTVYLDKLTLGYLREYTEGHEKTEPLIKSLKRDGALGISGINRLLKQIAKRAGLNRRIYVHMIRRTCASHILERGGSIEEAGIYLGHKPTTVTGKYYAAYGGEYIKKIFDKYVAAA